MHPVDRHWEDFHCAVLLNVIFIIVSLNLQEFCSRVCWSSRRAWSPSTCWWRLRSLRSPSGRRSPASPSAGSWPTSRPTVAMLTPPSPPSSGGREACWVTAAGWEAPCSAWRGREEGSAPALRVGRPCLSCLTAGWSPESSTRVSSPPRSTHPSRNAEASDCLTPTPEGGTPARRTSGEAPWVWVHPAAYPPQSTWPPDSSSRVEAGDTVARAGGTTRRASTMSAWASKKREWRGRPRPLSGSLQESMFTPWPPRTPLSAGGWSQPPAPPWSTASHCLCAGQPRKDTSSAATAWCLSPCLHPPCPLPVVMANLTCPSNTPPGWPGLCWEGPWSEGSWASWWISASWWVRRTAVTGLRLASDSGGNEGDGSFSMFVYTGLSFLSPPDSARSPSPPPLPTLLLTPPSLFVIQPLWSPLSVPQANSHFHPTMSLSIWLAAGSATHIPAHANWSDGLRLLLCLHCRVASPSCYWAAAGRGRREDGGGRQRERNRERKEERNKERKEEGGSGEVVDGVIDGHGS